MVKYNTLNVLYFIVLNACILIVRTATDAYGLRSRNTVMLRSYTHAMPRNSVTSAPFPSEHIAELLSQVSIPQVIIYLR